MILLQARYDVNIWRQMLDPDSAGCFIKKRKYCEGVSCVHCRQATDCLPSLQGKTAKVYLQECKEAR